jgi:beta-glucanase (GH16 family)/uncharacterized protein YccT (UPF0319 family)
MKHTPFSLFRKPTRRNGGKSLPAAGRERSRSAGAHAEAMESRLLLASTPTPPNIPGNWALSFNDNFTSINSNVWSSTYWWGGNNGTQATFKPSALSVNSNGLNITATKVASTSSTGVTNPYTSGLLQSGGVVGGQAPGFSFTYGYVEATTKIAPGQGMWSAIWMLPEDHNDNRELDLLENLGRAPNYFTATYHWGANYFQPPGAVPVDETAGFHTYGVDWEPDHITWYFDGAPIGTFTDAADIVNRPLYLILNLDVGGAWAGPLTSASPASSTWQIQDLRVWQHTTASAPSTPTNLAVSAKTQTSVSLAWTASTDAVGVTGYNILRNGTKVGTVAGNVTTYTDTGLTAGTTYSYTVNAFNAAGLTSGASSPLSATTQSGTTTLNAPTNVFSSATTTTSVSLGWTASTSTGITGYNILRNGTKVGTVASNVTTYTDTGLAAGTTYSYTVTAFNSAGATSAPSSPLSATTQSATSSLNPPTGLFSSSTTSSSVAVSWIASTSTGVTGYNVYRNGAKIGSVAANFTYFVDTGLTPGTTYTYTANAFNASGGVSALSAPFVVATLSSGNIPGPTIPTGLFSSATTMTSVAVSWIASTDSVGVTGYNVFRNGTKIGSVAGNFTYLMDTGLSPGTTYTYTVNAFNAAGGVSATSAPFVVTTLSAAGVPLTKVNLAGSFNSLGIATDGSTFAQTSGLAGSGTALSANVLGTSQTWNGSAYTIGAAGGNNVVAATGQTIALPQGSYGSLSFLGLAVNGNQSSQSFVVHYTDGTTQTFTQSMSDWFTPQSFAGESNAISVPYINYSSGVRDSRTFHIYGYRFALNTAKTVASITLPSNGNVQILAINLTNP